MKALGIPGLDAFKLDILDPVDRAKCVPLELDVLVNNAGVGISGSTAETDMSVIRKSFEINVFALIEMNQVVLPGMVDRGKGTIVLVSSIAGRFAAGYSTTSPKFAP